MEREERRRLLRELHVCMKSKNCPYTITFYGAKFGEVHYEKKNFFFFFFFLGGGGGVEGAPCFPNAMLM